jgi:hypothetical protein
MSQPAIIKIKIRTGTSAEWLDANPVLLDGELAWFSDTKIFIVGNGINDILSLIDYTNFGNQFYNWEIIQSVTGALDNSIGQEVNDRIDADSLLQDAIDNIVFDVTNINGSISSLDTRVGAIETLLSYIDFTLTAKGQILVLNVDEGKYSPLQVGANGKVLTADDTNAYGVSWSDIPASSIALEDITDVNINPSTLAQGDTLQYDAINGEWINSVPSTFTSPLTTKGDVYVRDASDDVRLPVGLDTQILSADSTEATGLKWISNSAPVPLGYYAQYFSFVSQSATTNNVGKAMAFETPDINNGISVVTDGSALTKITFAHTGKYNLQFSTQFQNTDNQHHDVYIWLRKNGTTSASDVAGTTGLVSIPARKGAGAGNEGHTIVSWNYLLDVVGGDYYQIVWATNVIANVTIEFYASTINHPSTASTLFTITQLAGILAGTGVTAINGLSNAVQTFASNGSGTDFNIASSGSTHTFNLPSASATNRGALTSADFTTFNNKFTSFAQFRKSGRWYNNGLFPPANANFTNQLAIRYVPFFIDADITITRIGINVNTIAPASSTCRVGVYNNDASTCQPSTRIVDAGTMALDSTGAKSITGLSVALTKGLYWLAYVGSANSGTISGIGTNAVLDVKGQANIGAVGFAGFNQTFTYGALPSSAGTLTEVNSGGTICIFYYY